MFQKKDPRGDLGKWAEKQVGAWLEARSQSLSNFAYHRYPDARAARGALAAQPADFLVGCKVFRGDVALHLEVKETAQARRLPRSKISQYGSLLKFHWAGFRTLVVVYRSAFDDWTYFTGAELFEHDECPTSFAFIEGRSFPNHTSLLDQLFNTP